MKKEMKKEIRLIDANEVERKIRIAISSWNCDCNSNAPVIARAMEDALQRVIYAPTVDAVSRGVVDQIRWERDYAMKQLEENGIPFGGIAQDVVKVVRCKDCKHLNVLNRKDLYAHCPKTNTVFLPFELDTRTHYCSLGERKDNG